MKDTVIRVEKLSKEYRLGTIGHGTLRQDLQSWWARLRGREDPNSLISIATNGQQSNNGRFWALKDVSFDVEQGEVLGIIGKNGAGKSTLLKILSRITAPTTGTIKIKGRIASLLEVGTGFHPELTGRENVYLNGTILGMKKREVDAKFDEIVKFAEIERFIDTPVKRYSSGMYVRLAFAVAAHLEPEILIIDEVLAVGDAAFQKKCLGKIGSMAKEKRTVLFVSHNMGFISSLCERCIWFSSGDIKLDGLTGDILKKYLTVDSSQGEINLTNWSLERIKNGPMWVSYLAVKDCYGKIKSTFHCGEPIYFEFFINSNRMFRCIVGVSVRDQLGQLILHLTNTDNEVDIVVKQPITIVSVGLDNNILNRGTYSISIWVSDELNILHDRIGNCLQFSIINSDNYIRNQSSILIPSQWKVS